MIADTAKFLDQKGELKPSDMRASQVIFERKSEHMGKCLQALGECLQAPGKCLQALGSAYRLLGVTVHM